MPLSYNSEEFAKEVEDYYNAKTAYTDLLYSTDRSKKTKENEDQSSNTGPRFLDDLFQDDFTKGLGPPDYRSLEERLKELTKSTEEVELKGANEKFENVKDANAKSKT